MEFSDVDYKQRTRRHHVHLFLFRSLLFQFSQLLCDCRNDAVL